MFFLSAATMEAEAGQAAADLVQQVRAQLAQRPDGMLPLSRPGVWVAGAILIGAAIVLGSLLPGPMP